MNVNGETFVPWDHFLIQMELANRYRDALDKIAFQTRDYAPTLECCQRIAREALNP